MYITITKKDKFFTSPGLKRILGIKFRPYLKSIKLGLPTACEDLLWNLGNLCIIRILNTIDKRAAGIYSMVFTVEILFVVVIGAIGNGTMTLTGEATGAKDMKLYRNVVKTAVKWAFLVAAFALIFVSIFPRLTLSLFTTDKEVIEMSVIYIILVTANLFGKSGNIILEAVSAAMAIQNGCSLLKPLELSELLDFPVFVYLYLNSECLASSLQFCVTK